MNETFKTLLENTKDACYCLPGKCIHINGKRSMRQWMYSFKPLHSDNKQGVVYTAHTKEFGPIIIKHLNKPILVECGKREILSGFQINFLKCPFFVETLGYFYRKSGFYVVTKYVFGDLLKNVLTTISDKDFIYLLMQMCIALETVQEKFLFTHYDLHTSNVIVQRTEKLSILFDQYKCDFTNTFKPIIIDFGMSCGIDSEGISYGTKNLEEAEIYDKCQPGYDLYTFLLYCSQIDSTRTCTQTILSKFYKNQKNYRLCLRSGAANKTPKQLFEYILKTFKPQGVEPRRQLEISIGPDIAKKPSFIDHHYYKRSKNIKANEWIQNDLQFNEPIENLIEKYWKMKFLKLPSKLQEYRNWEKTFLPAYKKYWKEKPKKDAEKRSTVAIIA
jgi:hypothetical protein